MSLGLVVNRRNVSIAFCVLILSLVRCTHASAQGTASPPCDDGVNPKTFDDMTVVRRCEATEPGASGAKTSTYETTRSAELGDRVVVLVRGLARLRSASAAVTPAAGAQARPAIDWSRVVLFLDGQPLKGVNPRSIPDAEHSHLEFVLKRDSANREAWNALLSGAIRDRAVPLSVGFEGQAPLRSDVDDFQLVAIPTGWLWTWLGLCAVLLIFLFWAARTTNLLRTLGPEPAAAAKLPAKPFSLGRTQMAVWFFVILASFVFIWLVTGDLNTLTSAVLGLAGISAATAVAGNTIDAGRQASANPPPATLSRGFFTDILSDEEGVSLARVQVAIWTVVLVVIFARSVWRDLAMPQFDATLLGLMGISNGTFIGFKGLER